MASIERGVHNYSKEKGWVKPQDPKVLERLEWFQDQKLGIMMHWGPYSQLGIVESWALSDNDAEWSREGIDWDTDSETFKQQYFALNKTFNPIRFQPDVWAELAATGGFKYLIFTTKHHGGFCMWDTNETDYKITAETCPFHTHQYKDICKQLFNAFRAKGLGIATYFSKADWHSEYYWAKDMNPTGETSRGPTYDPEENPQRWEQFIQFTHNQIMELMTAYGDIDILWLDAGWVGKGKQDIRLGEVVEQVRKKQPGLIAADRTIGGLYENYITPEQTIPDTALTVPWESCITMGTSFSFKYDDTYKSTRTIVHTLIEVVAKGGNLALNVAPQPDGRLPETAQKRMQSLGAWLDIYGEAIYGTRICEPYFTENIAFTRKDETVYGFHLYQDGESLRKQITIPYTANITSIELLGSGEKLTFEKTDNGLNVTLPEKIMKNETPIAHVFKLNK
jgi:alpha-L-fucosidase